VISGSAENLSILLRHLRRDHQIRRLFRRAVDVDAAAAQPFQRITDGFVARQRPRSGAGQSR
jgi:hypothetical protein